MEMKRPGEGFELSEPGLSVEEAEFELTAEEAKALGVELEKAVKPKEEPPMDEHEKAIRERVAEAEKKYRR